LGAAEETAISALRIDQELFNMHNVSRVYTIKVNVRTLDACLQDFFTPIDFVSIDTEGTELDVLKGFSIAKYHPKLLVVENNFNNPNIEEYLDNFGYKKVKRHIINDFYMVS
jgi:FkbM family methyltransferase